MGELCSFAHHIRLEAIKDNMRSELTLCTLSVSGFIMHDLLLWFKMIIVDIFVYKLMGSKKYLAIRSWLNIVL